MSVLYDRIGRSHVATRGEHPRIAAAIHDALGDARTVLDVGAGFWLARDYLPSLPGAQDVPLADLESGEWSRRNAKLLELNAHDFGYRVVVAE